MKTREELTKDIETMTTLAEAERRWAKEDRDLAAYYGRVPEDQQKAAGRRDALASAERHEALAAEYEAAAEAERTELAELDAQDIPAEPAQTARTYTPQPEHFAIEPISRDRKADLFDHLLSRIIDTEYEDGDLIEALRGLRFTDDEIRACCGDLVDESKLGPVGLDRGGATARSVEYTDGSEGIEQPRWRVCYDGHVFPEDSGDDIVREYWDGEAARRLFDYCERLGIPVWLKDTRYDFTEHNEPERYKLTVPAGKSAFYFTSMFIAMVLVVDSDKLDEAKQACNDGLTSWYDDDDDALECWGETIEAFLDRRGISYEVLYPTREDDEGNPTETWESFASQLDTVIF